MTIQSREFMEWPEWKALAARLGITEDKIIRLELTLAAKEFVRVRIERLPLEQEREPRGFAAASSTAECERVIHRPDGGGYVISENGSWLPGRYDTKEAAEMAFEFEDDVLLGLKEGLRRRITVQDLLEARNAHST